jgi:hypothetical protein
MLIRLATTTLVLLFACSARGTVYLDCGFDSPPSSEEQGGVYTCGNGSMTLFFGTNQSGPLHAHDPTGGWDGGGAVKFYSHTSGTDTYRYLDPSTVPDTAEKHIRYLFKVSTGASDEIRGKWSISETNGDGWRTWHNFGAHEDCGLQGTIHPTLSYNGTWEILHGGTIGDGCGSYQWCEDSDSWEDSAIESCTRGTTTQFNLPDWEDEWIVFEIVRTNAGVHSMYIWTEDGTFDGLYYSVDTTFTGNPTQPAAGAYLSATVPPAKGSPFWMDEIVFSDGPGLIGPPAGFGAE